MHQLKADALKIMCYRGRVL